MKLADNALLEIIDIVREGISEGRDISQMLRDLDLSSTDDGRLGLSSTYQRTSSSNLFSSPLVKKLD